MRKLASLLLTLSATTALVQAENIKGTVVDKTTKEPLIGATIQVAGTTMGTITDFDGKFELPELENKAYTLIISYVSYQTQEIQVDATKPQSLEVTLSSDDKQLNEVTVVARKNLEGEKALLLERKKASVAVENIGSKEMSVKGISNVEEGVKKITGISIASAGQLIVRGLGDRYSTTTLNGLPIASPNPDNKLIPLDLFPTSTVKNITVSKVYEANTFADYSGAHIDISTKESTGGDFFNIGFNMGGQFNTLLQDFYTMDRAQSLFKNPGIDSRFINMEKTDFETAVKNENPFNTSFDVKKRISLPNFSGNIAGGKDWEVGGQTLSLLASFTASNGEQTTRDAFFRTLEAGGSTLDRFNYDSYAQELKLGALANLSYTLRTADHIGYTFFYSRNIVDTYMRREGIDYEDHNLIGNNNTTHIYSLQNHQINGHHEFGKQWELNWSGSYSKTGSNEPDRRQLMFEKDGDKLKLFKLNRQETMRYFGALNEEEWVGDIRSIYRFDEKNFLRFGAVYKDKQRDFNSTRFYYNLSKLNPEITDTYITSNFMGYDNVQNGTIVINRDQQPKDQYEAGHTIYAAFAETEYYPMDNFLLNIGLRYERSEQWVNYATDGGQAKRNELNTNDLFPAVNMKYTLDPSNSLRLSVSRTVTRPSFIEMAPFLYQESYGSSQIRGNADLKNGYNYNLDLRYEFFDSNNVNNMIALTGYGKILQDPIERTQTLSGGAAVHSFQNASTGVAAGLEVELRRELTRDIRVGVNGSFMYTNVKLPEDGGAYTNAQRALQGASPYLVNADISYTPTIRNEKPLTATLLYNLQGPRIHAVGISGLGDEKQLPVHTLDFVASYQLNNHFSLKLEVTDLLNQDIVFKQETKNGDNLEVERFKRGTGFEIGFSYAL
ncbi:TonB-dependent receptor [Parabacteroides sp. AD58]|uniref:TonB-dependent receptor n=1 Tax=Parabacteroides absconsus TaxID=2951805 RepID=A0ABZ2II94_9BACT|nr:TonB-dependent receptor [Parabacteroides sp. AD58]MCM6903247.1 TonB-dependent receptor [Parabacteroides sp. AD58]